MAVSRKTPNELERRRGNPSHRPIPQPGAIIERGSKPPDPPVRPGWGPRHHELWETIWRQGAIWLAPSDSTYVVMLVDAMVERDLLLDWTRDIRGRFIESANGTPFTHPMVTQLRELDKQVMNLLQAIAFSPSERSRLGLAEVKLRDELEQFEARRSERAAKSGSPMGTEVLDQKEVGD